MEKVSPVYNIILKLLIDYYFWRTYDQQEIDFLEVDEQDLRAFECKSGDMIMLFENPVRLLVPTLKPILISSGPLTTSISSRKMLPDIMEA